MSRSLHRANRRQRKKMHLGEFQEMGFMATAKLAAGHSEAESNVLLHSFIEHVESHGLAFGGGMGDDFNGFVVAGRPYGKVEEQHRELVRAWLAGQNKLKDIEIGELRDAWYGWG